MKSAFEKETPAQIWMKVKDNIEPIRQKGLDEFIEIYNNQKDRKNDPLKFGDEVEFYIAKFDHNKKKVRLCTKSHKILEVTDKWEKENGDERICMYKEEFASYMIEGIPSKPYGVSKDEKDPKAFFEQLLEMEKNLQVRRKEIRSLLEKDEHMLFCAIFPRIGCEDFTFPKSEVNLTSEIQSIFMPESAYFPLNPVYFVDSVTVNERIGKKVKANVPIFKDKNTPNPFVEKYLHYHKETDQAAKPDHIYFDDGCCIMGTNCTQITIQAADMNEARYLFDQLVPTTPIMMAISAAAPIYRGHLSEIDTGQPLMRDAVDDRTSQENGEEPIKYCDKYKKFEKTKEHGIHNPVRVCECKDNHFKVPYSRFGGTNSYLSKEGDKYNDLPITYNIDYYQKLVEAGVDHLMARYMAFLFIREPLSLIEGYVDKNQEPSPHYLKILLTNWGDLRFKSPYTTDPSTDMGWRVEYRTMDLQINDFENSAYNMFVVLLSKVILVYKLDLLIPLTKNKENIESGYERDAVNRCKFWFRKNITRKNGFKDDCELMTIDKIINGDKKFPGLMSFVRSYLDSFDIDKKTYDRIDQYLKLISNRASGRSLTTAQWIRKQVVNHPSYKFDSVVTDEIAHDYLVKMQRITDTNV